MTSSYERRRAVEREQLASAAERDRQRRLERLDVRETFGAELRPRPLAHVQLPLGRHLHAGVDVEEERVGVAEHDRTVELPQVREHVGGLAAALERVAEADDLVHGIALEVGGDSLERDRVSMDVRDQCGADAARLRGGACASTRAGACSGRP